MVAAALLSAAVVIVAFWLRWWWLVIPASLLPAAAAVWAWIVGPASIDAKPPPGGRDPDLAAQAKPTQAAPGAADVETQPRDLRLILEAIDEPVLVTGASGQVELCNRACGTLLGKPAERVLGRTVEDLFTQVEVLGLHAAAAAGRARRGQLRIAGESGPRVYQVLAAPIAWRGAEEGGRSGVVLTLRDVTELAIAVSLKTDFVANASHEFRTPLSSIKAAVETLEDGAGEDAGLRDRFLRMISGNVTRLEEVTRDLLDLSRLESPETPVELAVVSTGEIESSLRELFEPVSAEKKLTLEFDWGGLEAVRTDRRLAGLVLKNLIDNATKFAYDGTAVRIVARALESGAARVQVIDQGVGIPIANQARVFERFYQVDLARTGAPARRGTGLGLAIVKHAVKALGGTIAVQSVWKEGTTMTVELPGAVESRGEMANGKEQIANSEATDGPDWPR